MIIIDDKEYTNYNVKITWDSFYVISNNEKRTGIAPFITFCINENIYLGLEFSFSKEMFKNIKFNNTKDVKKYLSDITYEDKSGWISIIIDKYICEITRINESDFKLYFSIESEVGNIIINTDINLL